MDCETTCLDSNPDIPFGRSDDAIAVWKAMMLVGKKHGFYKDVHYDELVREHHFERVPKGSGSFYSGVKERILRPEKGSRKIETMTSCYTLLPLSSKYNEVMDKAAKDSGKDCWLEHRGRGFSGNEPRNNYTMKCRRQFDIDELKRLGWYNATRYVMAETKKDHDWIVDNTGNECI